MNRMSALIAAVINAAAAKLNRVSNEHLLPPPLPRFAGQHTNPRRNEERQAMKAMGGRRQYRKRMHAYRMAAKRGAA